MSLLLRNYSVSTRYGGGFVQSIDGLAGGQEAGRPVDWFYYVNGVEAAKGAAATNVHPGRSHLVGPPRLEPDRRRARRRRLLPRAVPQRHRWQAAAGPGRMRQRRRRACRTVTARLRAIGVPAAIAALGAAAGRAPCACSSAGLARARRRRRRASSTVRAPAASTRASRRTATLTLLDADGRRGAQLSGRRRADRGHPPRRRSARLGRHRDRPGRRATRRARASTRRAAQPLRPRRHPPGARCRVPVGAP